MTEEQAYKRAIAALTAAHKRTGHFAGCETSTDITQAVAAALQQEFGFGDLEHAEAVLERRAA